MQKSDAQREIRALFNWFHSVYGRSINKIHTDNGGGFADKVITAPLFDERAVHLQTSLYRFQSSGMVETVSRVIMNRFISMLKQASLCSKFWGEAALAAVDI